MGLPALLLVLGSSVLPASGCTTGFQNVPPSDGGALVPVYADIVVSFTTAGGATACTGSGGIPACMGASTPQSGPCAGNPALGPPDGSVFTIPPGGNLTLGFLCSIITARPLDANGKMQPDFVIYGSLMGGSPIIEVSYDGTSFQSVNPWTEGMFMGQGAADFELSAANIVDARFVRISETSGSGSIDVDALEAPAGLVQ